MTTRARTTLLLLALPHLALAAGEGVPAASPGAASPAPAAAATPAPAAVAPVATGSRKGGYLEGGWGLYEVLHVGAAYHVTESAAFDLFGGVALAGARTASLGVGFRQAIWRPIRGMDWGWDLKALYWTQSDSNYDWKIVSAVFGGFITRDLDPRLSLKLDAGVALNGALESDRKQNQNFGHPTRWNGSVCLEVVYRLGGS